MNRRRLRFVYACVLVLLPHIHGCAPSAYESLYESLDRGDADRVAAALADTLSVHPSDPEAQKLLGIAWYRQQRYADSDSLLTHYCSMIPDDAAAAFFCASSADSLHRDAHAITMYRQYVRGCREHESRARAEARIRQLSYRMIQEEVRLSLSYEASLPQADTAAIAVLPFHNYGADSTLDPLGRAMAEMMATDLSKVRAVKVVERLRMQAIVDELSLAGTELSSPEAAPRAGRLAGAQRIVKGSFAATDDGMMHLDASVAKTTEAEAEAYASVLEPKEHLFRAEKKLVLDLLRSLRVPVSDDEREAILSVPTENYFAFVRYAQGLECERLGLYAQASACFREAVSLDPHFTDAKDMLEYADAMNPAGPGGTPVALPSAGGSGRLPESDAITSARERAASTLTETTGGYAPGFTAPAKTNPVLIQRALPAPPAPPKH